MFYFRERRPKGTFTMEFVKKAVFGLLVLHFFLETDAWLRRRRRRRSCSPRNCEVSSWSSWSSCIVLNNVDNKDHNDGQESKYLSRVVEDQNVLPYRKHGHAMVHDQ